MRLVVLLLFARSAAFLVPRGRARAHAPVRSSADEFPPPAVPSEISRVRFSTTAGPLTITLRSDRPPHGAERFTELVQDKYYDGSALFRAVRGFLVQWGIAKSEDMRRRWHARGAIRDDPLSGSPSGGFK